MSVSTRSQNMEQVSRGLRAYFAPVLRDSTGPTLFDPAIDGQFDLEAAPAPWIDAGWVDSFQRTSDTKIADVRSGKCGATGSQFRAQLGARVSFEFRQWGKLQMALAAGSEHFNVLESDGNGAQAPVGGSPMPAARVEDGSTAAEIVLQQSALQRFNVGDVVAVDEDYRQQTGYLGTGIPAAYCANSAELPAHPDYVRRVTFNVARVASKSATSLILEPGLIGGAPVVGGGVQKVVAFADREGGTYFQEWSALFVLPEVAGGRLYFYYPRLQTCGAPAEAAMDLGGGLKLNSLLATFRALPLSDDADNEPVLCYRIYVPPMNAPVM